jgi:hypothetical protein
VTEQEAVFEKWQEELIRHVAYIPMLADMAGVSRSEVLQALDMMFYTHKLTKQSRGGMQ